MIFVLIRDEPLFFEFEKLEFLWEHSCFKTHELMNILSPGSSSGSSREV